GGIAVNTLGHGHPALVEAAVKLSRRTGRGRIIAAQNAFHGRTTGALALTWKEAYRAPFEPLMPGVTHVPFNDQAALAAAVAEAGDDLAAVVLEPIQGEAGVIPADPAYLRMARELTTATGALLVLDEIQSGMGRTGHWLAHHATDVVPDAVTLAKGLAGGVPVGALVTYGAAVTGLLAAGQHGSTFGGNPLACAAGLATIHTIESDGLLAHASETGAALTDGLLALGHDRITGVRGRGLLLAVTLSEPVAASAMTQAREAGFLVNAVGPYAIRLAPPLILGPAEVESFLTALPLILDGAEVA
ncbi:MAG: aminotransferase class III-fold pyridoxal phosphate-dependent enzyme, partial [Actinomycetota bacterium]|nr:aminotransferase class III-fold pyridoxal phosphate-dependent enzyme [Actinomycetota bacterium]